MKKNTAGISRILALLLLIIGCVTITPQLQAQRQPIKMNFKKLVLYHAKGPNKLFLAAVATDDSVRMANLDPYNVHAKIELLNGESILIDNGDLNVISLGTMYNEEIGRNNTLFRFNLIIDNSSSVDQQSLAHVQHSLQRFIELVPLVFEAQIIRFSHNVQEKTAFCKDKNLLVAAITRSLPQGGTALYDAIDIGVQELKYKQDDIPLRFAVVLTDGKDTASTVNRDVNAFTQNIVNQCRTNFIPLFIVGVTDNVDQNVLMEISKFGYYRHISKFPDIDNAFNFILGIIKDTYVIKIPAVRDLKDIKTIWLVKKTPAGNYKTIQDIIVN